MIYWSFQSTLASSSAIKKTLKNFFVTKIKNKKVNTKCQNKKKEEIEYLFFSSIHKT